MAQRSQPRTARPPRTALDAPTDSALRPRISATSSRSELVFPCSSNIPKEHVAKPESDDEGIEDYDCTHDQQLSDQEDLNSVDEHSMEDDDQEANEVEEVYNNISPEIK